MLSGCLTAQNKVDRANAQALRAATVETLRASGVVLLVDGCYAKASLGGTRYLMTESLRLGELTGRMITDLLTKRGIDVTRQVQPQICGPIARWDADYGGHPVVRSNDDDARVAEQAPHAIDPSASDDAVKAGLNWLACGAEPYWATYLKRKQDAGVCGRAWTPAMQEALQRLAGGSRYLLTAYAGHRDRSGGREAVDALMSVALLVPAILELERGDLGFAHDFKAQLIDLESMTVVWASQCFNIKYACSVNIRSSETGITALNTLFDGALH